MKISKEKIQEIIDGDGNMLGSEDTPQVSPDQETQAAKTTDYNAKVHGQNFKNDFLGRFGFYFYESEGVEKSPVVEAIEGIVGESTTIEIMEAIKPHIEEMVDSVGYSLHEGKVVEDKITDKKDDKELSDKKKDSSVIDKKTEKVAELLSKLNDNEIDKLINLLESKKKSKNVTIPDNLKNKMKEVSLGKDDDGYYVYTHRARSKSYESPDKIPDSKIKYIETTG